MNTCEVSGKTIVQKRELFVKTPEIFLRSEGTKKKGEPRGAHLFLPEHGLCYAGLTGVPWSFISLLTGFLSSVFLSSVILTSGVAPGFPDVPVGDATGDGAGLAVVTGAGVGTGLFGATGFASQAPRTAAETAKTDVNINDLLIVFLLKKIKARTHTVRWQTSAAGGIVNGSFTVCRKI